MRRGWSTLTLVVIFLGLLGYIYFVQSRQPSSPASSKPKVFAVHADKIEGLTVRATSGEQSTLSKAGGKWRLVTPVSAAADESEIDDITTSLSSLTMARVIDKHPTDLKQFGLASPRVEIGFRASGDKATHLLLVGDKNATGIDLYAKRKDSPEVFLIPSYLDTTFNLTPFQLRDKTLLRFDRDKVAIIDVTTPEQAVELTKTGTTSWMMQKPLRAPASYLAAENLLGRLQTAKMKSIVTEKAPADLKAYGLNRPAVTVRLTAGSATTTLELGAKAPDGNVYARDLSRPRIVTVEASLLDDLRKAPADYRQKGLFAFRSYNADWIEVTRNGHAVTFQQVKGSGKNAVSHWHRLSPAAGVVKGADMEDFLSKLSNLSASAWIASKAHTGLDKPYLTVSVKFDHDTKRETVTFGRQGSDVYAERADQPGAARVAPDAFHDAMKAFDVVAK